jgi:cobalt-zinc-cadmium efflux system membrane fusion protein
MLRDGDFAVEVTIFETNVPPEFRIYAYVSDKPLDPRQVSAAMSVSRLGGVVDRFAFRPESDYLRAQSSVTEPHSFDVSVTAARAGKSHRWSYATYEGRTTIARSAADAAGVRVERAGPATIEITLDLTGRVEVLPEGRAEIRAWYSGRVVAMTKNIGDYVRKGETIARVESADSLQVYGIPAPFDGIVVERNAAVGTVATSSGDTPLYVVIDPRKLHAHLSLFPQDAEKVRVGQKVVVRSATGALTAQSEIETIVSPETLMPTRVAHANLPADPAKWWPGMGVQATVTIAEHQAPLAVRTAALQRFRDFTVVYARVGNTYEVRMLELGRQSPDWTEVLGGLAPGTEYVTENAFLIRADVEKSGATHDH